MNTVCIWFNLPLCVSFSQVNCPLRSLLKEQRTTPPSCGCFSVTPAVLGSRYLDFFFLFHSLINFFKTHSGWPTWDYWHLITWAIEAHAQTCKHTGIYLSVDIMQLYMLQKPHIFFQTPTSSHCTCASMSGQNLQTTRVFDTVQI